jgi:hypothetical protein
VKLEPPSRRIESPLPQGDEVIKIDAATPGDSEWEGTEGTMGFND